MTFTKKDEFGRNYIEGTNGKLTSDILGRFYGEAIDRLAEYENNKGSERERMIELIQNAVNGCARHWAELIADKLLANDVHFRMHSNVVVLPCKEGDKVYRLNTIANVEKCAQCEFYYAGGMGDTPECEKTFIGDRSPECIEIEEVIATKRQIYFWLYLDDFGKKVFLTFEEAENALKAMRERNEK